MMTRLAAARDHYALGPHEAVDFYLVASTVRLTEEDPDVDLFVQQVRDVGGEGASLVIIDTLSQSMAGKNENAPADMTAAISAAKRIMDGLGAGVLIIHHSGKNEAAGARGHSSLRASTDTELEVRQDPDGLCCMTAKKQKEGETGAEWYHRMEQVEMGLDQDGDAITTAIVNPVGETEAGEAKARRASGGRKPSPNILAVVNACADLHGRGDSVPLTANVLDASGYRAHISHMGWDTSVTVRGFRREVLTDLLRERDGERDGKRDGLRDDDPDTVKRAQNAQRQAIKRKLDTAIAQRVLWSHGEWVWMAEPERDV
jgi:hypothetical protein